MTLNFLETETENNKLHAVCKSAVISRNTENRNNHIRVLKNKFNEHKYKQFYIYEEKVG